MTTTTRSNGHAFGPHVRVLDLECRFSPDVEALLVGASDTFARWLELNRSCDERATLVLCAGDRRAGMTFALIADLVETMGATKRTVDVRTRLRETRRKAKAHRKRHSRGRR